jgi:hypothetical protein
MSSRIAIVAAKRGALSWSRGRARSLRGGDGLDEEEASRIAARFGPLGYHVKTPNSGIGRGAISTAMHWQSSVNHTYIPHL